MKNHTDVLIFHTAFCAEASQRSLDATTEIAYANFCCAIPTLRFGMENSMILDKIRQIMKEKNAAAYVVLSDDYHNSEYVNDFFKFRAYISGFTGSAGTLVITKDKAGLWTDGRYFIQADKQLMGTGIDLYKMGTEGTETVEEFLLNNLSSSDKVFVDGRTLSYKAGINLVEKLDSKGISLVYDVDFSNDVWENRPSMPCEKAYDLDVKYAGETRESKIERLRKSIMENNCTSMVCSALDDICWLLNIRGNDVKYNPVVMSYLIVTLDKVFLYVSKEAIDNELISQLGGITVKEYNDFYEDIKTFRNIDSNGTVLVDDSKTNYTIGKTLADIVNVKIEPSPITKMKAIKNPIEMENIRKAHIFDGIAVSRFMYYVKSKGETILEDEYELGELIAKYRAMNEGYMGESFEPIVASGPNGAMCHYEAKKGECSPVLKDTFLLFDTGGQYLLGTTDITRTIIVGTATEEMKKHYTAVLKGNLNLGSIKFPKNVRGINLDVLARMALWEMGLDYNHGTGHGVGYFLNVHEGPNSIRFRGNDNVIFEEGMLTSNEPGYYEEGNYGIRLENLIMCKETEKTEYGQFMEFETYTMVPFDLDAIDVEMLSEKEKKLLNDYHQNVYETISAYLNDEEKQWLREACRKI